MLLLPQLKWSQPPPLVSMGRCPAGNPTVDQLLLFDEGCMTLDRRRHVSFLPLTAAELPKTRGRQGH